MTTPTPGDFSWYPRLKDFEINGLQNMYTAITKLALWGWLKSFKIDPKLGFQFDDAPEIGAISTEIADDGHSSASFGWCMINMMHISTLGWGVYYTTVIEQNK
jgi:hypothetical protein